MPDSDFDLALVVELAKKSSLVWIAFEQKTHEQKTHENKAHENKAHAVWHEWVADAVCVVSGGTEQPLPGIEEHATVTLGLRSKTTRQLVVEAVARVERVEPKSPLWEPVTDVLKASRLNLTDRDNAIERWADESLVVRLVPTGEVRRGDDVDEAIVRSTPLLAAKS